MPFTVPGSLKDLQHCLESLAVTFVAIADGRRMMP
jgi:hypothetical protein